MKALCAFGGWFLVLGIVIQVQFGAGQPFGLVLCCLGGAAMGYALGAMSEKER